MEVLKAENLIKIYGKGENQVKALNGVSLSVAKGEFVAVVGTSGWGAERRRALEAQLAEHPGVGVLIAPNFSVGSVLASAFAAKAAR